MKITHEQFMEIFGGFTVTQLKWASMIALQILIKEGLATPEDYKELEELEEELCPKME